MSVDLSLAEHLYLVSLLTTTTTTTTTTSIMDPFCFPHLEDNAEDSEIESSDQEGEASQKKEAPFRNPDDLSPAKPARQLSEHFNKNDLDYGNANADSAAMYGYGNAVPTSSSTKQHEHDASRQPRRSSLRGPGQSRRSSIGCNSVKTIEVRVRGERFPVNRRRSIDFARSVRVKEVEPVVNLNRELGELWLQNDEFRQMKEERKQTVKSAMRGNPNIEMRGLEKYVDKSIRLAKQVAWDTVLIEQDEQEMAGHYSPEKLAEVYKHYTREAPGKAAHKAKEDQQQIEDYVNTPRTRKLMMRRLSC
jgi:hypothetical protein